MTNGKLSERDEMEALLPAYVTGRLTPSDTARVAAYLEAHPDVAVHLRYVHEERSATIADNEVLAGPGKGALARLLADVAASSRNRRPRHNFVHVGFEKLANWLRRLPSVPLGVAATAVALLLLAEAASIAVLLWTRAGPATYETVSSPEPPATRTGTFAIISFAPGSTMADVTSLLTEIGAEIADGPRSGGIYRVVLAPERLSPEAAEIALQKLRQKSVIGFAKLEVAPAGSNLRIEVVRPPPRPPPSRSTVPKGPTVDRPKGP